MITALTWLPNLFGPLVGHQVDRRPRPQLWSVRADLMRALLLGTVPLAAALGVLTLIQMYVVTLLAGVASVVFATSSSRVFVLLLSRQDFVAAQGLIATARASADLAGPALGGILAQVIGAPAAVGVDAASFLVSAGLLRSIRVPDASSCADSSDGSPAARLRDGLRVLWHDRVLRACLGSAATVNLFTFLVSGGLTVLYARRELGVPPGGIGIALSLGSVGGVLAATFAPRLAALIGVGRTAIMGAVVFPLSLLILSAAHNDVGAVLLAVAQFVGGIGVMLYDIPLNAIEASAIPDSVRSSVVGSFAAVNYGMRPVGALFGGVLAGVIGLRATFVVAAIGGSMAAVWLVASPVRSISRSLTTEQTA